MRSSTSARRSYYGALVVIALLLLAGSCRGRVQSSAPASTAAPTGPSPATQSLPAGHTPEATRVLPSPTPAPAPLIPALSPVSAGATAPAMGGPARVSTSPTPGSTGSPTPSLGTAGPDPAHARELRARVGVAFPYNLIDDYDWGGGIPGWYLNWNVLASPPQPGKVRFAQMPRLFGDGFRPDLSVITATARLNPGALWLIGNEPDVPLQDNITPLQYARTYHTLYQAIKGADPAAQIAIAGVGQPTPLRMVYLDRILSAYRSLYGSDMPVDVWNVHAFILREERNSWGVGIPPGIGVDQGKLYELADHDNGAIFRQQILDFRRWMAARGQRDKPLIVTEYGILMPPDYGFPAEKVAQFMTDSFDFFLNARDADVGYPADDNRLVQAFCWYSAGDTMYPNSNLFDPKTRAITPLGERFKQYVLRLK